MTNAPREAMVSTTIFGITGAEQLADRREEVIHDTARAAMNAGAGDAAHLGLPGGVLVQQAPHALEVPGTQGCQEAQHQRLAVRSWLLRPSVNPP